MTTLEFITKKFFTDSVESILLDRKANLQHVTSSPQRYKDSKDYVKQSLTSFVRDYTRPLFIDIYLFHAGKNTHLLIEKWAISYSIQNDQRDNRPLAIIERRIQTLSRTLTSFVRLLPGYNRLHLSPKKLAMHFQIHTQKGAVTNFPNTPSEYSFPTISTSKGVLNIAVRFLPVTAIEVRE